ncbi:hypothetical protein ACQKM2_29810 [Streptomyces sp. NPDC004126]|uniref:hypothetical protein n=1 Tax=Streptomyces sp. NPDC004126 TaxID=3390695 RepID=UPI003D069EB2
MHKKIQATAVGVIAAIAVAAATPLASAAQAPVPTPAVSAPTVTVNTSADPETVELTDAELRDMERLSQELQGRADPERPVMLSGKSEAAKKFIALLKKSPKLFKSAIGKAKAGQAAFNEWMGKQNVVVRAAWWALGGYVQNEVWEYLFNLVA